MLDFSFGELLLLGVVALVVLGPEKLPHTMRMAGAWLGRIRRTVIDIQTEIEKEVQAQEMKLRIEKEMAKVRDSELAQGLKQDVADIHANLREAGQQTHAALSESTPQLPEAEPAPAPTPAGEEAFMAHVQSSHARAEADRKPAPATTEPEHKPIP